MVKKKICLITPSLRHGGSERVISELANQWCKREDVKVFLILLSNQEQCYDIDSRVELILPNKSYKKNFFSKTIYKIWIFYFIRKTCLTIFPDSVLSFGERYNNIVLLSLLKTSINVYVSDRNSPFWDIGFFHKFLRKNIYKYATGIIAQTETAMQVLTKTTGNTNIVVIPNPLREIQKINSRINEKLVVLNVGRIDSQKNQLELIEMFSQCDYKNWILKIVGSGPLKVNLIEKVNDLGISDNVQIFEFSRSIDTFYSEAEIFAFSSLYEGFPNALNEAMAHGIACVSYDCPTGPRDIIQDGENGYLVKFADKKQFINKLSFLMESSQMRKKFSEKARRVKDEYSLEKISDKYFNFITLQ